MALSSDFPFVKMCTPENMIGYTDTSKCAAIKKVCYYNRLIFFSQLTLIALRGRSKSRTGYLETTQMGRTNKARLAVCSKAIVKLECLVFVFFSRLDDYNQTLLLRGE